MAELNFTVRNPVPVDISDLRQMRLCDLRFDHPAFAGFVMRAFNPDIQQNRVARRGFTLIDDLRRAGIPDRHALQDTIREALDRASNLRHAAVIEAKDAVAWIAGILTNDPSRVFWHIDRLDGVSASSAWAYVAEMRGERATFNTARELDMGRLMKRLPDPANWHMYRGTHLEALASELLYRQDKRFERDAEGLEAVRAQRGTPELPWLIGNPDDISLFRPDPLVAAARVVNDYKNPAHPHRPGDFIPMEYRVQLHNYALMAGAARRQCSGLMLTFSYFAPDLAKLWSVMLDRNPELLPQVVEHAEYAFANTPELVGRTIEQVPIDRDLVRDIIAACSQADERVLRGDMALYPAKASAGLTEQSLYRARLLEQPLVAVMALEGEVKAKAERLKSELKQIYYGYDTKKHATGLRLISLSSGSKLDTEKALAELALRGVDTSSCYKTEEVVVSEAVKALCEREGVSLEEASSPTQTVQLSRIAKGSIPLEIDALRTHMRTELDGFIPDAPPSAVEQMQHEPVSDEPVF